MDALLQQGYRRLIYGPKGSNLVDLVSGRAFRGLLGANPPIDPNTELGADPREKALLEVISSECPPLQCQGGLSEGNNRWKVVARDANPADFVDSFVVVKVVAGKDT